MSIVKHADCLELERLEHIHKHLAAECMSNMGLNNSFDLNSMKSKKSAFTILFLYNYKHVKNCKNVKGV